MKIQSRIKVVLVLLCLALLEAGCSVRLVMSGGGSQAQAVMSDGNSQAPTSRPGTNEPGPDPPRPKGKTTLTINVVGDIMMHSPQIVAARKPDGTYDFRETFREVKPLLENADITMGNLETTISTPERGYSGYPLFKSPEALLEALKYAGFDVITTANNHSLDGKEFGVIHTLNKLDEHGLLHTGRARSMEERNRVLIIERRGIKVAVLAYTYGTNGMEAAVDRSKLGYLVNYYRDINVVEQDIQRARKAGADVIVACMHWGPEYSRKPNNEQRKTADVLFKAGVDIIFGSHPHVLQPMERKRVVRADGSEREVFVIYSLGNFISNQTNDFIRYTDSGIILNVEIVKDHDTNTVMLGEIRYVPTWVHRYVRQGRYTYRILPVTDIEDARLEPSARARYKAVWRETTELMGDQFKVLRQQN